MVKYGSLMEALEGFRGTEGKGVEVLEGQFRELAEYLFYGGYFSVNGKRRVYLRDLEFYYHEEEGSVQDLIMYHRDAKSGKKKAYFPLGMLHTHQSGVDITFENEARRYRAAVLVRGYNAMEAGELPGKEYDKHSTHLYDDLFMAFSLVEGIHIEWIHEPVQVDGHEKILQDVRMNVCEYDEKGWKRVFEESGQKTENGKYVQDMRMWRFIRDIE